MPDTLEAEYLIDDPERAAVMKRLRDGSFPAMDTLVRPAAEIETTGASR